MTSIVVGTVLAQSLLALALVVIVSAVAGLVVTRLLMARREAAAMSAEVSRMAAATARQRGFVADVSHELRTPLTTIQMAAEVLFDSREDFPPDARRAAELLADQVDRFELLLSDLLEISRFDSGAAVLSPEAVDVRAAVANVVAAAGPLADTLAARVDVVDGDAVVIEADRVRLERTLRNLVVNALNYGGPGVNVSIVVAATEAGRAPTCSGAGDGPGTPPAPVPAGVVVQVVDDGPGLPAGEQERVFERFWRADPSRARDTGGAGLGLAIAAEDVLLHGGMLRAWDNPTSGATFAVWLPASRPPP